MFLYHLIAIKKPSLFKYVYIYLKRQPAHFLLDTLGKKCF